MVVKVIVPCYNYSCLLFYVLNYVSMLTLYFIMILYTVKNSMDEIPIVFIKELVAICSGTKL